MHSALLFFDVFMTHQTSLKKKYVDKNRLLR